MEVVPRPKNTALPKPGPQIAPAVPANLITTEVNVPDNLASAVQAAADQFRANYRPGASLVYSVEITN